MLGQIAKKFYAFDLQNQGYSNIIKITVVFEGKNINLKLKKTLILRDKNIKICFLFFTFKKLF